MNARPSPPPCPRCQRTDQVEEEDQTGSSARWYICHHCGLRYSASPSTTRLPGTHRPPRG